MQGLMVACMLGNVRMSYMSYHLESLRGRPMPMFGLLE